MEEYYDSMREVVEDVKRKFTPPFRPNSFFHDIVITDEEVEILKGIIGDNYIF